MPWEGLSRCQQRGDCSRPAFFRIFSPHFFQPVFVQNSAVVSAYTPVKKKKFTVVNIERRYIRTAVCEGFQTTRSNACQTLFCLSYKTPSAAIFFFFPPVAVWFQCVMLSKEWSLLVLKDFWWNGCFIHMWKLLNTFYLKKKLDKLRVQLQLNDLLYFIFQNKCCKCCGFFPITVFASELRFK